MEKTIKGKRKKLGLSQQELAGILGMSRQTFIKIEKGERSLTKSEQEKMTKAFESFDTENQETSIRISIPKNNEDKFREILLYILEKVGAKPNVGLTVLYKLLYFIDFDYYEKYGEQLIGLTYFKNTHGPTPRYFAKIVEKMKEKGEIVEVKSKYFRHEQKKFLPNIEHDLSGLNGRELEMIEDVLKRYSDKTAQQLSDMTHRDMPWKATEKGEDIDYELVFYRSNEFSVRDYDPV